MWQEYRLGSLDQHPDLTDTLVALTHHPDLFSHESVPMQRIERFIVLMYSKGCGSASVNEARHQVFTTGNRSLKTFHLAKPRCSSM